MAIDDTPTPSETEPETDLPVPATPRTIIRVKPTEDALTPQAVETHFRRLHQLGRDDTERSLLDRLLRRYDTPPIIECLLISRGENEPVEYSFSIDNPDAEESLEHFLRSLFPRSYEFERRDVTDQYLRSLLDVDGSDVDDRSHGYTPEVAAVEFLGEVERPRDWQTQLTPFRTFQLEDHARVPLGAIVEQMATSAVPMVYQALLRAKHDWSGQVNDRIMALEAYQDTIGDQLVNVLYGEPEVGLALPREDEARIEELRERDTRSSFEVNARLVAVGTRTDSDSDTSRTPRTLVRELTPAFADVSHTSYQISTRTHTGKAAHRVADAICERTFSPPTYGNLSSRLSLSPPQSRGIVADSAEVASFCLFGGDTLTDTSARAVAPTPGEQTSLPQPPFEQLARYRGEGMVLGKPLTHDGTPDAEPLVLPPTLQTLHIAMLGKTGSGKSTTGINAMLSNHSATDGASIFIDNKGEALDYLRAHFATFGTLNDVLYFNCADTVPAFSFFDIRDELAAGVSRTTAVEDRVGHYIEILTQIMGKDRFEQAIRSPDVIEFLIRAIFDPVNGYDAFSHRDLRRVLRDTHERQAAPAVSNSNLEDQLASVVANDPRTFDKIMLGVATRVDKIASKPRLARVFDHIADPTDETAPHFDLADYLDRDVVIIFDTGDLRSEAKRALTMVILSNLWTALRRRTRRHEGSEMTGSGYEIEKENEKEKKDLPLVNLHVEEAASVAVSDLLKQLLAQSRSFGCSVTLAMQFPEQISGWDSTAYSEVLNNVSTFVTGNVPDDPRLARRLATDEMDPQSVANRLRALRRGQWLVSLPAGFGESEPRPFLVESVEPPAGDPEGPQPLSTPQEWLFEDEVELLKTRTQETAGLTMDEPNTTEHGHRGNPTSGSVPDTTNDAVAAETGAGVEEADAEDAEEAGPLQTSERVDSALPYTRRLPPTVQYLDGVHALQCVECNKRYDPDIEGMKRAIECCSSLDDVDADDVPVCDLHLKLTPEERASATWTDAQLRFLQAVYNAQQLRYDRLEYDLFYDSMIRLQEYVDIDSDAVTDLLEADLLRHDTDRPHRLYTVSPEGRKLIGEGYREGVDYGHGTGDLEESTLHVFAVEVGRRYMESEYVDNPESSVTEVVPYYEISEGRRLDIAGLDADGEVVVTAEAERVNHDLARAAPDDFDKMAECEPDEAIWIAMSHSEGHEILRALREPLDGEARVEKSYASTSPVTKFRVSQPGFTGMFTVEQLRDHVFEA